MENYDALFKLALIGDAGVGKSNVLSRYTLDKFKENSSATVGIEFGSKIVQVGPLTLKLQIWDTAGHERFRTIPAFHFRGAVGIIVVYSIVDHSSFRSIKLWLQEIEKHAQEGAIIMLVGNKEDLKHLRAVPTQEAKLFADQHNLLFIESSALSGHNIERAFELMLLAIYNQQNTKKIETTQMSPASIQLSSGSVETNVKKCCM